MQEVLLRGIKNLSAVVLSLLITACSNTEEEASKALSELGNRYEAVSLWNLGSPRPGLMNEDDVDVALNAILEIRTELDAVLAKFPETNTAKDILSEYGIYTDRLSIQKIEAQIKYLKSEKSLFQHRSKVLKAQKSKSISSAFGFSFFEKSETTCQKKSIDMYGVRDFIPSIQDGNLNHFFIKFDSIIDLLISIKDLTDEASNTLDTSERDYLGIEAWNLRDNKSKLVYDNMLRLFIDGHVPDYLENPDGVEVIPAMVNFRNLSNKSMIRCSSKENENEFKTRVGTWLPPGRTYYLDAIGSKNNQVPVFVLLYSFAGKSDKTELTAPVIIGLNKKYGNAIAEDRSIDFLQQSWITDEGILIILRFDGDRDPLSYAARFSLTYIYLPTFMGRYHEFLKAYLTSFKHIVDSMHATTERRNDQRATEIDTKL